MILSLLLFACSNDCGTITITTSTTTTLTEPCGPVTGTWGDADWTYGEVEFYFEAEGDGVEDLDPDIAVLLPASGFEKGAVFTADEMFGAATVTVDDIGTRAIASLVSGTVEVLAESNESLLGEERWKLAWDLTFEDEAVTVVATGKDKVDFVDGNAFTTQ